MTILKFRFIRNLSWLTLEHGFRLVLGLLVGTVVARYLGPASYGVLNYAGALVMFFATVSALVPESLIIRELIADRKSTSGLLAAAFIVRIVSSLLAYISLLVLISSRSDVQVYSVAAYVVGTTLFFQSTDVFAAWFLSHQSPRPVVLSRLGAAVLASILRLLLVWYGGSILGFATVIVIESVLTSLFLLLSVRLANTGRLIVWPALARIKILLQDGWPLFIAAISATLYLRLDLVMIGVMRGEYDAGLYSAATRLSEIWYFLPTSVAVVIQPILLRNRQLDHALFVRHMRALYTVSVWSAAILALTIFAFADELVLILFGREFRDAAPILRIHAWAAIPAFLGVASSLYLVTENLVRLSWYRTTIGLIVNILLNLVWIPQYGGQGAAWATVISYFMATFSLWFFAPGREQVKEMITAMTPAGLLDAWRLYRAYQNESRSKGLPSQ
jgi:PST family polysaccharide transporter